MSVYISYRSYINTMNVGTFKPGGDRV
jgi:hypothetical protein